MPLAHPDGTPATRESVMRLLVQEKLTVNHVKDNAGKRGSTAHDIAERFVKTGEAPDMAEVPDEAESYVRSAADFLVGPGSSLRFVGSEVMVWSPEDWFAGTFDGLVYDENDRLGLIDYKTSKRAYDTHVIQLAAYERARRVLKLDPVDFLAVVHISGEGCFDPSRHWFEVSGREIDTSIRDFLSIKQTYDRMQGRGKRLKDLHKSMNPKAR
jgi:hypothetical protein